MSYNNVQARVISVLIIITTLVLFHTSSAGAATFTISTPVGLRQAIIDANDEVANPGLDVIDLGQQTITLTNSYTDYQGATALPQITSEVIIRNGIIRRDSPDTFRLLSVAASGNLTLEEVTLENGSLAVSSEYGGAIASAGSLTLVNSIVRGHSAAEYGGAIFTDNTSLTVTGSVISGNLTYTGGAGIYSTGSIVTLTNVTLAGNMSPAGSPVYLDSTSSLDITNSIVAGNTSEIYNDGTTLQDAYNMVETQFSDSNGNLDTYRAVDLFVNPADPVLAPTTTGDYRLRPLSPVIDAGSNTAALATSLTAGSSDAAGVPRFADDTDMPNSGEGSAPIVDMGAYEFQGASCSTYSYPYVVNGTPSDLKAAIGCANLQGMAATIDLNGQTITLADFYRASDVDDATGLPYISGNVTLQNGILTRDSSSFFVFRLLYVKTGGMLTLNDVTLQNGGGTQANIPDGLLEGGAIYNAGDLVLNNSTVENSDSQYGGGIFDAGTSLHLDTSVIRDNSARVDGGGLLTNSMSVHIFNSTLTSNTASGNGGAIFSNRAASTDNFLVERSILTANTATNGAGLYHTTGGTGATGGSATSVNFAPASISSPHVINSLLSGNAASANGGAIFLQGYLSLVNATLSGNAASRGGGMYNTEANYTIQNSIIQGNQDDFYSSLSTYDVDYSIVTRFFPGTGNIREGYTTDDIFVNPVDPVNAPTASGDYTLQDFSPAIDAGSNTSAQNAGMVNATLDAAGNPRFEDDSRVLDTGEGTVPVVDMGAYELQPVACSSQYTYPYTVSGGSADLIKAIICANQTLTSSVIDLNGQTFELDTIYTDYAGFTGLPQITTSITLQNGTIQRAAVADSFRLMYISTNGNLTLKQVSLTNGTAAEDSSNAQWPGAGIYNSGQLTVINSRLFGHDGHSVVNEAQATIISSLIYDESPIYNMSSLSVYNSTIWSSIGNSKNSDLTMHNSILLYLGGALRLQSSSYNIINGNDYNIRSSDDLMQGFNPEFLFVDPANHDYQLRPGSPAIDAGSNALFNNAGGSGDIDGNNRFLDDTGILDTGEGTSAIMDIGAYEFQHTSCTTYSFPHTAIGDYVDLVDAITCANNTPGADVIDLDGHTYTMALADSYYSNRSFSNNYYDDPIALPPVEADLTLTNGILDGTEWYNRVRFLTVASGATLTLEQVTLQRIDASPSTRFRTASAIYTEGGNLILRDSYLNNLDDCAVRVQNGSVTVVNTRFEDITETALRSERFDIDESIPLSLHIENSTFQRTGQIDFGSVPAIGSSATTTTIRNVLIEDSHAGIAAGGSDVLIENSVIRNNSGAGIRSGADNVTIRDTQISNNGDSGLELEAGNTLIERSYITGNTGVNGGAIYYNGQSLKWDSVLRINDSIITGNVGSYGGAIYLTSTAYSLILRQTTISGNRADNSGGSIYVSSPINDVNIDIASSILWDNSASNGGEIFANTRYGDIFPQIQYSLISGGYNGDGNIDPAVTAADIFVAPEDPASAPTSAGDYRLLDTSPAVNRGNATLTDSTLDLDGNPRVQGGEIDMGAYETSVIGTYVAFVGDSSSVDESSMIPDILQVTTGDGNPTATDIIVEVTVTDGTTGSNDYTLNNNPFTLMISAGTASGTQISPEPDFSIADDYIHETDETVQLFLSDVTGTRAVPGRPFSYTLTIIDNDSVYDTNQDGIISPADVMYVINRIGATDTRADVNADDIVDDKDVQAVLDQLGQ